MATAAFKSNSRRSNDYRAGDSTKTNPHNPNPPPQKQRLRRSLSVSALSRSTQIDISSEFLKTRDNPLYWAAGGSPADNNTETPTPIADSGGRVLESGVSKSSNAAVGQRGRSVQRNSDLRNDGQKEEVVIRRRSLSRVNDTSGGNGNGRRGRSISRAKLPYGASESEAEQESRIPIRASNSTRKLPVSRVNGRSSHLSRHPSVGSSVDSQISNWEDGISTGSLSEAEEKTIKAVYEQMKSLEGENSRKDITSSEIYETVRSEVRRAIADFQDDLQHAIQRNGGGALASTNVTDTPPKLVLDIRREYAKELEESQERSRKLRSDLAIEEHRKQELSRILKETLPDPKTSVSQRSRLGRKSSSERKKMSKRLTDEAMSYFDECVSISTFDSSDFSASEEPSVTSVNANPTAGDARCITVSSMIHDETGFRCTADGSRIELVTDRVVKTTDNTESSRKSRFSFGQKPTEIIDRQYDIKNYIKIYEKDTGEDEITSERIRANYNVDVYDLINVNESSLFDKVFYKNRLESGSLHICDGFDVPFLGISRIF